MRGVPGKMAFTECTSVSNNGISVPSVFLEGFDLPLAATVVCTSLSEFKVVDEWYAVLRMRRSARACGSLKGRKWRVV